MMHDDQSPEIAPDELARVAAEAAQAGGQVLMDWVGRFSVREKRRADLVTEADHASQEAIHQFVLSRYPDHGFLGEEGLDAEAQNSPYQWVIDPLDGTSNYVHGFPYYCVSVAVRRGDELVAGVVFDPNRSETFSAARGQGATLNGQTITTSGETVVGQAMAMASLPIGADSSDPAIQRFLHGLSKFQTVQRTGSAALNLCCVACGRIDVFWSSSLKPWDVAAGVIIVEEAGGRVTRLDGSRIDIMQPDIVAASSEIIARGVVAMFS